jgi:hypothetical protein
VSGTAILRKLTEKSCLIGCTGLVGSNLSMQRHFSCAVHSSDIYKIHGYAFDTVVCAGISGTKWKANLDPGGDKRKIDRLFRSLEQVRAKKFILISTIDVYGDTEGRVDEDYDPSNDLNHSYGKHRQQVEQKINSMYEDVVIVRLPGIYGRNLKKNAIFDLLMNHEIEKLDSRSVYQWYSLDQLNSHIQIAVTHELSIINLFPEPCVTGELIEEVFPDIYEIDSATGYINPKKLHSAQRKITPINYDVKKYDLRTKYSQLFASEGYYIYPKSYVLKLISTFRKQYYSYNKHVLNNNL